MKYKVQAPPGGSPSLARPPPESRCKRIRGLNVEGTDPPGAEAEQVGAEATGMQRGDSEGGVQPRSRGLASVHETCPV